MSYFTMTESVLTVCSRNGSKNVKSAKLVYCHMKTNNWREVARQDLMCLLTGATCVRDVRVADSVAHDCFAI